MALFRRLFYRKPPDRLLEITDRVYVFDCCFSTKTLEEDEFKNYIDGIVLQLQDHFPEASFMVFNFQQNEGKSLISSLLALHNITTKEYLHQFSGCPLLPLDTICKFLIMSEAWLTTDGSSSSQNIMLMHCESGGWPLLAFMLASLLLYRKQYTGEQRTLEMVYKQGPRELLGFLSPLNPTSSHLRYLDYVGKLTDGQEQQPQVQIFTLDCLILRTVPSFDRRDGCRPIVRVYGRDSAGFSDKHSQMLFSTHKTKKYVKHYKKAANAPVKLNVGCRVEGDVVLECIHLDRKLEAEEVMFRVMFNTKFIQSHILVLTLDDIDLACESKNNFSKDFKAEVLFSEFHVESDTSGSDIEMDFAEEFFEAEEMLEMSDLHNGHQEDLDPSFIDSSGKNAVEFATPRAEAGGYFPFGRSARKRVSDETSSDDSILIMGTPKEDNFLHEMEQQQEMLQPVVSNEMTAPIDIKTPLSALCNLITTPQTLSSPSPLLLRPLSKETAGVTSLHKGNDIEQMSSSRSSQLHPEISSKVTPSQQLSSLNPPPTPPPPPPSPPAPPYNHKHIQTLEDQTNGFPSARPSQQQISHKELPPISLPSSEPIAEVILILQNFLEKTKAAPPPSIAPSLLLPSPSSLPSQSSLPPPPPPPQTSNASLTSSSPQPPPPPPRISNDISTSSPFLSSHNICSGVPSLPSPPHICGDPSASPPLASISCDPSQLITTFPLPPPPPPPPSIGCNRPPPRPPPPGEYVRALTPPPPPKPPSKYPPPPPFPIGHRETLRPLPPPPPPESTSRAPSPPPPPVSSIWRPPPPPQPPPYLPSTIPISRAPPPPPPPPPVPTSSTIRTPHFPPPPVLPPPPLPSTTPTLRFPHPPPPLPPPSPPLISRAPPPPPPSLTSRVPPPPPSSSISKAPPPPPPLPLLTSNTPPPPLPPPLLTSNAPPPPPPPPSSASSAPPPRPPPPSSASNAPPPPPPPPSSASSAPPPPPPPLARAPPPPSPPSIPTSSAPPPPPPPKSQISRAPPPPPPPGGGIGAPPPPPPPGGHKPGIPGGLGAPPPPPSGAANPQARLKGFPGNLVGGKGLGIGRSSQLSIKKSSLKPLHWNKVTRVMNGTLWAELQRQSSEPEIQEDFDLHELEQLFSAIVPKKNDPKADGKQKSAGSKSDKIHLIDLRRANNTEIMLTKIKMPLTDMMNAVLAMDDLILDGDQVENLLKFCPTKEEMETLKNFPGDKESLGKCEQYFLELMKVPRVESKLRVFSFKIQFTSQLLDIRKSLQLLGVACDEIRNSEKLKEIMKKILNLGNTMNQGTARGSAVGFRLDSLLKLADTRGKDSKVTLMHYLCKVTASKWPHLMDFHEELVSLEAASKIQLKVLTEEQEAISKGLKRAESELKASIEDGPVSEIFHKTLEEFVTKSQTDVENLKNLCSAVDQSAKDLTVYFGEDPAKCPFEQVIGTILNFMKLFQKSHEENLKNAELAKKKVQKDAEMEKTKEEKPPITR